MKPILKWQYDKIIKELILLQEHEADPECPCRTAGEMCVRKHLLAIEGYAQETAPIEEDPERREILENLGTEAKRQRESEERALCGQADHPDLMDWSRNWRKAFEEYSLACEMPTEESCPVEVGS